jgi:hypothetical protein
MSNYSIIIGNPIDYEELVADIKINDTYVARIQKDEGNGKMIIDLFEESLKTKIYMNDLIAAMEEARSLLLK